MRLLEDDPTSPPAPAAATSRVPSFDVGPGDEYPPLGALGTPGVIRGFPTGPETFQRRQQRAFDGVAGDPTIPFTYDDATLLAGVNESALAVYRYVAPPPVAPCVSQVDRGWIELVSVAHDGAANQISVEIAPLGPAFSAFALGLERPTAAATTAQTTTATAWPTTRPTRAAATSAPPARTRSARTASTTTATVRSTSYGGLSTTETSGTPDPQCTSAWRNSETGSICGLGAEVALAVSLLRLRRRRREGRRGSAASGGSQHPVEELERVGLADGTPGRPLCPPEPIPSLAWCTLEPCSSPGSDRSIPILRLRGRRAPRGRRRPQPDGPARRPSTTGVTIAPFDARFQEDCEALVAALPDWFGIPESNAAYLRNLSLLPSWVALLGPRAVGAVTLEQHFPASFEVHFMAVRPEHHRRGIGRELLEHLESEARARGGRWLHVKTLAPSHPDPYYARTRAFYERRGSPRCSRAGRSWGPENPAVVLVKGL